MSNRISFSAIAAMAALSMVSLMACSDENPDITNVPEESGLSSSSTPSVEPESSSSSGLELSSSSAPLIESESSSSGGVVNLCEPLTEGAITRFWVKDEGDRLKDACSEPLTVIGDDIYAEDCNAKNDGRVLSLWSGNPKYGYMTYYKCQKDSWVKGDISLTCDTAGVAVGDTCVKQYSINIFLAGMYPTGTVVSFVYKGDGVWAKVEAENADGDSVQVYIEGVAYSFPACNAEREGTVEKLFVGNPKYGSDQYFKCEQGSWNMKSAIDIECNQANAKIGDVCSIDYFGYLSLGGPIRLSCYVYTENGWTYKGYDDWYDPTYAGTCEELLNAPDLEKECTDGESAERTVDDKVYHYTCSSGEWQIHDIERPVIADTAEVSACPAESEGMYETVLDTIAVYGDGNIMEWTSYYHCESGKWVKSDCRDPLDACTADNEGEMKNVVCSQQPGNPKAPRTEWDFVCKNKKWEKMSAEESKVAQINARCTKDDTKIGDICSIVSGGNVAFGIMPNVLNCYVYTEEGWVAKGSAVMSENTSCEDILNPPAE